MATRRQLEMLRSQIEALRARINPVPPVITIKHPATWTAEQIEALRSRHFEKYPHSRRTPLVVLLKWWHDDPDFYGRSWEGTTPRDANHLDDVTWRELAREWELPVSSGERWNELCSNHMDNLGQSRKIFS